MKKKCSKDKIEKVKKHLKDDMETFTEGKKEDKKLLKKLKKK